MRGCWTVLAGSLATISAAGPAQACTIYYPQDLEDLRSADVVVLGRITNYEIVARRDPRPEDRTHFWGSGHARFDLVVDEVLAGRAGTRLSVAWINSTFAMPRAMSSGQYLIALVDPGFRPVPLRGPGNIILSAPEKGLLIPLQAHCSEAFMFESMSEEALAVRRILDQGRSREASPGRDSR